MRWHRGARGLLDRHVVGRVVTISCSSTVQAILEDWPPVDVLVGEGRPGLEGRALAAGLAAAGRRVTLCTDASLPALLEEGDLILSGADAVEADGTLVNKVGTLALALSGEHLGIPVFAAFVVLCGSLALWPPQKNYGTLLSCSAAVMLGTQFWHAPDGGIYMNWYLPLLLLTIFRPNLEDRVALTAVTESRVVWRRRA